MVYVYLTVRLTGRAEMYIN